MSQKNDTDVAHYIFNAHQPILVIFGRDVAETACYRMVVSERYNIYISRLCYDVSVRLSVTKVHWRIIANLGFKF